jgi:hypothetical protein
MSLFNNTKIYFCKYVDTATKGVVAVDWATIADRVKLTCTKCGLELTATKPKDDDSPIDYGVQAFVNLHAHNPPKPESASPALANWGKPQVFNPLPSPEGGQTQIFQGGSTDKSFTKQAIISDKLKQYQNEVNAKTDDLLALKIAQLQAEGAEKAAEAQKNWLAIDKDAEEKAVAKAAENSAKAAALKWKFEQQLQQQINENKLKKAQLQAELESLAGGETITVTTIDGMLVKVSKSQIAPAKKDVPKKHIGALEEPEGRKFR